MLSTYTDLILLKNSKFDLHISILHVNIVNITTALIESFKNKKRFIFACNTVNGI